MTSSSSAPAAPGSARHARRKPGGASHRLHHQGLPDPLAHRRGAGRHRRRARQYGRGRLALAHVRHRERVGLARRPGRHRISRAATRRPPSTSSSIGACRSRAPRPGNIYQRPFGGMTTDYGKGIAQRTCAAADRTGHAMLHTMYGQALRQTARVLRRVFRHRPHDGRGRLPRRRGAQPRRRHASTASARTRRCSPPAATAAPISPAPRAHTCTGDGNAMVLRAGLPLQDMEFVQFHPTGIYGAGMPDHRGRARRGRLPHQFRRRALHGALRALGEGPGLARRGLARHDARDPRGARRRQGEGPHRSASGASRPGGAARAAARHLGDGAHLRRRRRHAASRSRSCRPCTTIWAASPRTITARC